MFHSCTNVNRDKSVDRSKLTEDDYRLFQNTPAWMLAIAVQDGDEKKIIEIVSKSPQVINAQEPQYGNTLLMLTIINQQFEQFKVLLDNKADVTIHNTYNGTSALIEACSSKQYNINFVRLLLRQGADVNDIECGKRREGNSTRLTPLIAASKTGNLDLIRLLIDKDANINYRNEFDQSALSESVMIGRYDVVIYLLQNGADFKTPIFYRPDYTIPSDSKNAANRGKAMYLVDLLRENFSDFETNEYKYKMQVVAYLKKNGIDYRNAPIPNFIKSKAQEKYPNNWRQYLDKY